MDDFMRELKLGKTGIVTVQCGFGALPIQRTPRDEALAIIGKAFEAGITFFDTARAYTDSEEKLGEALSGVRGELTIASKTQAKDAKGFWADLETSLKNLRTDYIDLYQLHFAQACYKPGDGSGLYEALLKARQDGKIRWLGITAHRIDIAMEAVQSGLYDTVQYPFSYLSSQGEIDLVNLCKERGVGFIAMKALSGGLINSAHTASAFINQFDNVLPIWGIQHMHELDEFIQLKNNPAQMDAASRTLIQADRDFLQDRFCRGCGYCMPCPVEINIWMAARMSLFLRRAPSAAQMSRENQMMMQKIENCLHCEKCKRACPYGLDVPALLERNYKDYLEVLCGKEILPQNF